MPYDIRIEVVPGGSKHVSAVCSVVCADVPDKRPDGSPSDAEAGSPGAEPGPRQLLESATDRFVGANTSKKLISQVREYYEGIEKTAVENLQRLTERCTGSRNADKDTPKNLFPEPEDRSDENSAGSDRNMEFFKRLVLDADHFIADRRSTGLKTVLAGLPWFADWGRDTMIAFTGLTLCTGRYEDAREILKSFAMYERNGLIPNMFPDSGEEPLYNTADASLWYFIAVWNYIRYLENSGSISRTEYEESVGEIGPQSNKHAMMKDRGHECEIRPEQNGSEQNGPDSFIRDEIYPALNRILDAYEHGTDNDIHMEPSGLIHAGSGIDQVTWMDVRVDGVCVTPRHGCPVEINALWYNALKIGGELAGRFGDEDRAQHCLQLADRVEAVFESIYYNKETGFLYDVVDGYQAVGVADRSTGLYDAVDGYQAAGVADRSTGDIDNSYNEPKRLSGADQPAEGQSPEGIGFRYTIRDDSLRPNQLYAVSLPFSPVSMVTAGKIVDTVEKELYVGCGIRSLAPSHRDYHGQYRGALAKRDQSYHQGTAWGFLLGAFITAYMKAYHGSSTEDNKTDYSIESMDAPADTDPIHKQTDPLERFFAPVSLHQSEANCIGGICEVFEGDAPHAGCGCYTQAWSTGEILRAYVETMS
ncbi:MAG: hypothetical protein IKS16_04000 [Lachnospiraceae bacterium]|nr:hypothetical protein [Lachnospiraceae bacterium]